MTMTPKGYKINSASLEHNLGGARLKKQKARMRKLQPLTQSLLANSVQKLAQLVESSTAPLEWRLAAGSLLALKGDPRLSAYRPRMMPVAGGKLRAGIDQSELARVYKRYKSKGVLKEWLEKECPAHEVNIQAFAMARYPVTNQEYFEYLNENSKAEVPSAWTYLRYPSEKANHPVYGISRDSALAYARWLSRKTGKKFRLPTEYEWEWAAQGASNREFPWGNTFAADRANTLEVGLLDTSPVGAFPKGVSPFGVMDLGGNVEEYVSTNYFAYPGAKLIKDDLWIKAGGPYIMTRGGSFTRNADLARCKRRHGYFEGPLYPTGFRLACDL
jgi:formylglycine-generating enzyme required for sulfatase activity